jgi:aconitate hydratase
MNSFGTRASFDLGDKQFEYHSLERLATETDLDRLPYSIKILIENLLRLEDGVHVTAGDIESLIRWDPGKQTKKEITFTPARVLMQDFTGVPAVVDLAAMREAIEALGGDPRKINPLSPTDLVIDHSVMVDHFGLPGVLEKNLKLEYSRNHERYSFLRWGQNAFANFRVVPPGTGIVHQVNLEYLANVVCTQELDGVTWAYPDTVVGTDSHTTMVNGLGVLGWGVGGIEAEAAMLGQPLTMLIPEVIGFCLEGALPEGVTATDLVLTVVEMLRRKGVVGKFVEFFGSGLDQLSLADQATISNMAPEYGATCGMFPIDSGTLDYLRLTGRDDGQVALVAKYSQSQGLFREAGLRQAMYVDEINLDLGTIIPSIAGPKRPQDRIPLSDAKQVIRSARSSFRNDHSGSRSQHGVIRGESFELTDGAVVIAAVTSCTNTSNPSVMMGAGLVARNAVAKGLKVKPWVKTSLAPGSQVVTEYLRSAGLLRDLEEIGFGAVGYGCTTCIGNSGPLPEEVSATIQAGELLVCSVLSGNRNFEGRVHAEVQMNFLASPPLVIAYALAGTTDIDFRNDPLGDDSNGDPVFLRDLWPKPGEIERAIKASVTREKFSERYADVFRGDNYWSQIQVKETSQFSWDPDSSYVRRPPYFDGMGLAQPGLQQIKGARVLAMLGDSITTDHISPAGSIKADSPAGAYLIERGVDVKDFNSYGARRGNHEVMMRGTFANIRLRNELTPGLEGGWTRHQPTGEQMFVYDAAVRYQGEGVPLTIIAGQEYGTGSSRDWAAKGPHLLGVRAVLVESFERIHRQNLVGMGILPLQFYPGNSRQTLGLTGAESYDFLGVEPGATEVTVKVTASNRTDTEFQARIRIDTPREWDYYLNGGILPYVIRQLL